MEVELKVYIDDNIESFDFNGSTYYETKTFIVIMNEYYPISVNLKPDKTFSVWGIYGVTFDDFNSTNTTFAAIVESGANCIPIVN